MADLQTDIRYIKGIGETRAKALGKLGISTLRDLISYFPRAYEDRTALRTETGNQEEQLVVALAKLLKSERRLRSDNCTKLPVTEFSDPFGVPALRQICHCPVDYPVAGEQILHLNGRAIRGA